MWVLKVQNPNRLGQRHGKKNVNPSENSSCACKGLRPINFDVEKVDDP